MIIVMKITETKENPSLSDRQSTLPKTAEKIQFILHTCWFSPSRIHDFEVKKRK